eukprot:Rmarinus@m.1901
MMESNLPLIASILVIALTLLFLVRKKPEKRDDIPTPPPTDAVQQGRKKGSKKSQPPVLKPTNTKKPVKHSHPLMKQAVTGAVDDFISMAVSSNWAKVAVSARDRSIRVYQWMTGGNKFAKLDTRVKGRGENTEFPDLATAMSFSADGRWLMACFEDSMTIRIYDLIDDKKPRFVDIRNAHTSKVVSCGVAPDGNFCMSLAVECSTKSPDVHDLKMWDMRGKRLWTASNAQLRNKLLNISPDSKFVAVTGFSSEARVYEVQKSKGTGDPSGCTKVMDLRGHKKRVQEACFVGNENGRVAVSVSQDGHVIFWGLDVRYNLREDPRVEKEVFSKLPATRCVVSPNGRTIALLNEHCLTFLNDEGSVVDTVEGCHSGEVVGLAFSPDGTLLMTAGDRTIKVWNNPNKS